MIPDYGDQQIQAAYLAAIVNSSDDAIIGKKPAKHRNELESGG